ncbi:hypothetical protein QOT17_023892 [Balamuthia mandrillaris]
MAYHQPPRWLWLVTLCVGCTLLMLWVQMGEDLCACRMERESDQPHHRQRVKEVVDELQTCYTKVATDSKMEGRGFLYFLVGSVANLYQAACYSARSMRANSNHQNFTIVTDDYGAALFGTGWCHEAFNQVINIKETPFGDGHHIKPQKVRSYQLSPYLETVFLDPDTMACGPVDELFELLKFVDLAAAYASGRHHGDEVGNVPAVVPELNTGPLPSLSISLLFENELNPPAHREGVLAFRDTEGTRRLFKVWDQRISERPTKRLMDQPSFRQSLLEARDVRFHVLPPEFNCRQTESGCQTNVTLQGQSPAWAFSSVPCRIVHSRRIQREHEEPFPRRQENQKKKQQKEKT